MISRVVGYECMWAATGRGPTPFATLFADFAEPVRRLARGGGAGPCRGTCTPEVEVMGAGTLSGDPSGASARSDRRPGEHATAGHVDVCVGEVRVPWTWPNGRRGASWMGLTQRRSTRVHPGPARVSARQGACSGSGRRPPRPAGRLRRGRPAGQQPGDVRQQHRGDLGQHARSTPAAAGTTCRGRPAGRRGSSVLSAPRLAYDRPATSWRGLRAHAYAASDCSGGPESHEIWMVWSNNEAYDWRHRTWSTPTAANPPSPSCRAAG